MANNGNLNETQARSAIVADMRRRYGDKDSPVQVYKIGKDYLALCQGHSLAYEITSDGEDKLVLMAKKLNYR